MYMLVIHIELSMVMSLVVDEGAISLTHENTYKRLSSHCEAHADWPRDAEDASNHYQRITSAALGYSNRSHLTEALQVAGPLELTNPRNSIAQHFKSERSEGSHSKQR